METDPPQAEALPELTPSQARVLGCLIEKEATTPDTYPLTVNAAHMAANQKTARDPVLSLDPGEVQHALRRLEQIGLARQSFSSRAERYEHRLGERLALTRQQVSLLGLLLLRGPQTAHELLARSERMARFEDVEEVRHHLERLAQHAPPLVMPLARGGGQRGGRYAQLLAGAVEPEGADAPADRMPGDSTPAREGSPRLEARVAELETTVAQLQARIVELESRS